MAIFLFQFLVSVKAFRQFLVSVKTFIQNLCDVCRGVLFSTRFQQFVEAEDFKYQLVQMMFKEFRMPDGEPGANETKTLYSMYTSWETYCANFKVPVPDETILGMAAASAHCDTSDYRG